MRKKKWRTRKECALVLSALDRRTGFNRFHVYFVFVPIEAAQHLHVLAGELLGLALVVEFVLASARGQHIISLAECNRPHKGLGRVLGSGRLRLILRRSGRKSRRGTALWRRCRRLRRRIDGMRLLALRLSRQRKRAPPPGSS